MKENELTVFEGKFGKVRTMMQGGVAWFVGKDVAAILGYERENKAVVDHVEEDDRIMVGGKTQSQFGIELGQRGGWIINESGLYSLILSSKLPTARQFKHWVTSVVLPALRNDGAYVMASEDETDDMIMARAIKAADRTIMRLRTQVQEMQPKALFADAVSASKTSILVGELAKMLKQNGVDMGQNRLFERLRRDGYLCTKNGYYNMPTQRSMEMGLFEIKETTISNPDGSIRVNRTTKVTGKGQVYFVKKFMERKEQCK